MYPLDGFLAASLFWVAALVLDLAGRPRTARRCLTLGVLLAAVATVASLPQGTGSRVIDWIGPWPIRWRAAPAGLWLMLPAWIPTGFAVFSGGRSGQGGFASGAALALLGSVGVLGLQNGPAFLVAWEVMGFGGAMMILSERPTRKSGRDVFFMLALLETGAVALLFAILLLGPGSQFASYGQAWEHLGMGLGFVVALLWTWGCGAKLGLLPYYEWYPGVYGSGSGASGALFSGLLLNMAYFALGRALLDWLGFTPWLVGLGIVLLALGILTAVLTGFYAFQQDDWRRLLAFSSAENAAIAVAALGAALIFRSEGHNQLAALAWITGLIGLMGHSLAKGALFFTADAVHELTGSDQISPDAVFRQAPWTLGIGALLAAMSLAALPPTIGFVSEWFLFQTLFHDFVIAGEGARIALVLAGAGLALSAAIALATMVKLVGVGLLGLSARDRNPLHSEPVRTLPKTTRTAILVTGLAIPVFAVSLTGWLPRMTQAAASLLHGGSLPLVHHWLLTPLSPAFAFISPAELVIAWPLLVLIPVALLLSGIRHFKVRRTPLWCGGDDTAARDGATTAFAFSNALRVFYSFIYRPRQGVYRTFDEQPYFLKELRFDYSHAPVFGPFLFQPSAAAVRWLANRFRFLQNGRMSTYLAYVGFMLLIIFALVLLWARH